MKIYLLLLTFFLSSCYIPVVSTSVSITAEAYQTCKEYCKNNSCAISNRDKFTFFCECIDKDGKVVDHTVVGLAGTLYE